MNIEARDVAILLPRVLHFGMSYGDAMAALDGAADWADWSRRVAAQADAYERYGDDARRGGLHESAAEWWRRASTAFHFAQIRTLPSPEKERLRQRSREAFRKATPLLSPACIPLHVPFRGAALNGWMRVAERGAPAVVLIGGLDSAKEIELFTFAGVFLRRGMTVAFFDGPGQGELAGRLPIGIDFHRAVSAVIDHLLCDDDAAIGEVAVFGVSFGGFLAATVAATDRRIRAAISLGGFHDFRILDRFSDVAKAVIAEAAGVDDLQALAGTWTLARLDRPACPLLAVHGANDHLVDDDQIAALRAWGGDAVELWRIEGADHVCTNRFPAVLPNLGDWMAARLLHRAAETDVA